MIHAGSPSPTSRSLPRRSTRSPARYLRRRSRRAARSSRRPKKRPRRRRRSRRPRRRPRPSPRRRRRLHQCRRRACARRSARTRGGARTSRPRRRGAGAGERRGSAVVALSLALSLVPKFSCLAGARRPRRKLYQVLYLFAHLLADSSSPSLFEFLPEFRLRRRQGILASVLPALAVLSFRLLPKLKCSHTTSIRRL